MRSRCTGTAAWVIVVSFVVLLSGCGQRVPIDPQRLTRDPGDETTPAFSPDAKSIAYTHAVSETESHVCLISIDGKEKRRVTSVAAGNGSPAWSPDGKWIVFQTGRDGKSNICVVSSTGEGTGTRGARTLTKDSSTNRAPSWSPDGKLIAFESDRSGRFDIWVMNADGTDPHVLTRSTSHDTGAAWSPDGKLIAFSSGRTGNRDIWIVNRDGSHPRRLTTDLTDERRPRWTPDSRQLVYMCVEGNRCRRFGQVFRTGKGARQLLESRDTIRDPVVSPDGRWLAFSSDHEGTYDIYLLKLDNGFNAR